MPGVIPTATMRNVTTTLSTDTTTFAGNTAHLFQNQLVITPGVTLSQLTEANFDGYSGSTSFAWTAGISDPVGNGYLIGPGHTYSCSDTVTANVIYGGYLVGAGADSVNVTYAERFANPINIAGPGDFVNWTPTIALPGPATSPVQGP